MTLIALTSALAQFRGRVSRMNPEAKELEKYMSALSEKAYCASWMHGLEYVLWKAVLEGRHKYGRLQITRKHTDRLKELSQSCAGWIVFDDNAGATFVPLERWQAMYDAKGKHIDDR